MPLTTDFENSKREARDDSSGEEERRSSDGGRLASIDLDEVEKEGGVAASGENPGVNEKDEPVTWMSLPHKRQLLVLGLSRLSEPLVQTSLQAYMFYQLKSFDENLSDASISSQAGMLAAGFTGAQFMTAMMWGRISDSDRGGRKMVIMIGLAGTALSVLGFGFSKTFYQAMFFRTIGGALNGNIGVMRTMISEIVREKKYQSRAFLLLPMTFNIGVIIGPILGGLLADPAGSYPNYFGNIAWLKKYPYAAPNILSACFLFLATLGIFFGLEETLESIRHREDMGMKIVRKVSELFRPRRSSEYEHSYTAVPGTPTDLELSPPKSRRKATPRWKKKLPFRRIFTYNVICTLIAHSLLATHLGTFNNLWYVFLSTPVAPPSTSRKLPFVFTGGLGMPPRDVGFAMAVLGVIGILMQLFIYPRVNARLGTVKSWRIFLVAFPVAYILVPYLSVVPSRSPAPAEKDGVLVWIGLCVVVFIQVMGRTFALPATTILVNNASPHPSVLGTMHGIAQSMSSAARTIGPALGGKLYGVGLKGGVVGAVFWGLSGVAVVNCVASHFVKEGDGHEIILEGDEEE